LVVNACVVFEVFYLFSVRYVHGTSLTLQGVLGTRAVRPDVAAVAAAQLLFTYLRFMNYIFHRTPLSPQEGAAVIAVGIARPWRLKSKSAFATHFKSGISSAEATPPFSAPVTARVESRVLGPRLPLWGSSCI